MRHVSPAGRFIVRLSMARRALSATQMRSLKTDIGKKHPNLQVEMFLMALDGKVEPVS